MWALACKAEQSAVARHGPSLARRHSALLGRGAGHFPLCSSCAGGASGFVVLYNCARASVKRLEIAFSERLTFSLLAAILYGQVNRRTFTIAHAATAWARRHIASPAAVDAKRVP